MIDIRRLRFDGGMNHQNGLYFYYTGHGSVITFYVDKIRTRKGRLRITMHPDVNHGRAHVHVGDHDASFAVDTGELLAGKCDGELQGAIQRWIHRHREDLQHLWDVTKVGGRHEHIVKRIQEDVDFRDFGFKGKEPKNRFTVDGAIIWSDDDIITDIDENHIKRVVCDGDMYVGQLPNFEMGSVVFESQNGKKHIKKL